MMKHVAAMQITTVIPWLSVKSNRSKYNMQLWPLDTYHYIVQDRLMGLQREWVQHRNKIIPRERKKVSTTSGAILNFPLACLKVHSEY